MSVKDSKSNIINIVMTVFITIIIITLAYNYYEILRLRKELDARTKYSYENDYEIDGVYQVSMIQLLSNPEKYHKKRVSVGGFYTIGFESNHLFLDSYSYENFLTNNCLWISLEKDFMDDYYDILKEDIGSFITIEGTFDAKDTGKIYSGTIKNVTEFGKIQIEK